MTETVTVCVRTFLSWFMFEGLPFKIKHHTCNVSFSSRTNECVYAETLGFPVSPKKSLLLKKKNPSLI